MVPIVLFICIGACVIGMPIAVAFARKIEKGGARIEPSPDLTARLERMEQAIDSIAIEVERIAENQRFTTKLLAERPAGGASAALPSSGAAPS